MKYKKRRNPRPEPKSKSRASNSLWAQIKETFKRVDRTAVRNTALWFLAAEAVYAVCNYFELTVHLYLYPILLGVTAVAYLVLNGGSFSKNVEFSPSPSKNEEENAKAEERFHRNRAKARQLLPILFALALTLCIDMIYLNLELST